MLVSGRVNHCVIVSWCNSPGVIQFFFYIADLQSSFQPSWNILISHPIDRDDGLARFEKPAGMDLRPCNWSVDIAVAGKCTSICRFVCLDFWGQLCYTPYFTWNLPIRVRMGWNWLLNLALFWISPKTIPVSWIFWKTPHDRETTRICRWDLVKVQIVQMGSDLESMLFFCPLRRENLQSMMEKGYFSWSWIEQKKTKVSRGRLI